MVLKIAPSTGDEPHVAQVFACRCEEVLESEIIAALLAGACTVDDVKRRTRAGMGACQGIYCMPTIAAIVAQATGTAINQSPPMTARPPVRTVPLEAFANLHGQGGGRSEATVRKQGD